MARKKTRRPTWWGILIDDVMMPGEYCFAVEKIEIEKNGVVRITPQWVKRPVRGVFRKMRRHIIYTIEPWRKPRITEEGMFWGGEEADGFLLALFF